ncbi:phage tail tape measure protein [Burkholderia pseudomallei]|uniref:phage tail tape measure protein n=1 Tax=pseudomallei group TaxID=111527 RepID=UPI000CC7AE34|nr:MULTISPECIES: phage tail tape measure protein [pseudomallei group]MCS6516265.1 phage tail tape measure protein [Burkholderia thailandensis]MCW0048963.1 phage tail tape measure protein [Burkholderia pseudomallei]PJO70151.1 phage tail protein [Burkholderia thailandensis]
MSNMVLRYVINLTGDLKRRATENARALEQASQRQTKALTGVDRAAQKTEKALEQVGSKTNAARLENDARRIEGALSGVAAASQRADTALARVGASGGERAQRYVDGIARAMARRRKLTEQVAQRDKQLLDATGALADSTAKKLEKVGVKTGASHVDADARRMQSALGNVANASQRADQAISRIGGRSSLDRMNAYLGSVARRLDDIRRNAERAAHVVGRVGQAGAAVVGGVAAGGAAAAASLKRPISFDERLGHIANVAYGDLSPAARILKIRDIEQTINAAVQQGGGSRDSAAEAMSGVIASGVVKIDTANAMLADLQKGATAGDADVNDISKIAVAGIRNFKLREDEIKPAISKAIVAGQEGSFEVKDMSRWLPELMASASDKLGMSGMADYEKLVSYAQASAITAGSADKAGNNLNNLILKINSSDTAQDFKKLGYNLPQSLARARERGYDGIHAFADFVQQIAAKDPKYMALKKKAETETGDQQKATYQAMASILQGSAVGQVIQDKEALMALIGIMSNMNYVKDVLGKVHGDNGEAMASNFNVISTRAGFKAQQASNEVDIARSRVFQRVEEPLNTALDAVTKFAQALPGTTTALTALGQAATVATAAGVGGALAGFLMNRGKRGGVGTADAGGLGGLNGGPVPVYVVNKVPGWNAPVPRDGSATGTAGAAGGAAAAAARRGLLGRLGGSAPWVVSSALAAYELLPALLDNSKTPTEKANAAGRAAAGVAGGWAGAQAGAALGAFGGPFAPVTVPIGGMLGGAIGFFGAQWAGDRLNGMSVPPSQRAGETRRADGSTVQVSPELLDRISILRTQPAYLTNPLTQPSTALAMLERIQSEPQKVEIGNGSLNVNVSVRDDRVTTSTTVMRQPAALRVDAGATNPGGRY